MLGSDSIGLLFKMRGDSEDARRASRELREQIDRDTAAIERRQADANAALSSGFTSAEKHLTSIGEKFQSIGAGIQNLGQKLAVSISLPLTALGGFAVKSALDIDKLRNKYTALEGSVEKANERIRKLIELSNQSVGVNLTDALDNFAQLNAIGGIAEGNINKIIQAVGRLSTAFEIDSQKDFLRNLTQIFTQGFEQPDIKEAIGRIPIFNQILEKAFGTSDNEKLKQLKESGKLTLDAFIAGFADAVQTDPRLAGLSETLSGKFAKAFDQIKVALEPLGKVILDAIIPFVEPLTKFIKDLSDGFANLSPQIQQLVVGFGAFAAILPPLLIGFGAIISAIGGIITAAGAISGFIAALGGLSVVVPIVAAIGTALVAAGGYALLLYEAWQTNFGGIRDLTQRVAEFIKEVWNGALAEIQSFTGEILSQIAQFWAENGEDIKRAVAVVSEFVKQVWQSNLAALSRFWSEHGESIKTVASAVWEAIKTIVSAGISNVLNVVKLVAAVINGDWSKAWDAAGAVVQNVFSVIGAIMKAGIETVSGILKGVVTFLINLQSRILAEGYKIGYNVGQGIINGIKARIEEAKQTARNLAEAVRLGAEIALQIQSPSKVFYAIGKNIVQGLIDGINALRASAGDTIVNLLNIPVVARLKKGDAKGAELLTSLLNQLAGQNAQTEVQRTQLELTKAAYAGINQQLREAILNTAAQIDQAEQRIRIEEQLKAALERKLEIERSSRDLRLAQLEFDKNQNLITEKAYIEAVNKIKLDALREEKRRLEEITVTEETRAEVAQRLALIKDAIQRQEIENLSRIAEFTEKQNAALEKIFEKYQIDLGGKKTEFEQLNDLLSNPDITEAIRQRAHALGMTVEHLRNLILAAAEANLTIQSAGDPEGGTGPEGEPVPGSSIVERLFGGFLGTSNPDYIAGIGEMLTQTMNGLAQATGNAVEAFIKFGTAGGSFRKFAAEMIAAIAKMAAIQAVWNLAEGFAKLALAFFGHPTAGVSATQHFIAAAVYGSIAGVAAVAGRAIAGDEFKKNSAAAGGFSQTASGGYGTRGGYSSGDTQVIEQGRNAPAGSGVLGTLRIELGMKEKPDWLEDVFIDSIRRNSRVRREIIDIAATA